jgi:arylsulfatase A-like enzyme
MSAAPTHNSLAHFVAVLVVLVSAVAGFCDVLWNGEGLSPRFALLAVLLWIGASAPGALLAAAVAFGLERRLDGRAEPGTSANAAAALVLQLAVLTGALGGLLDLRLAFALAAAGVLGLFAASRSRFDPRPTGARGGLALVAVLFLAWCVPLFRELLPRPALAAVMLGAVGIALGVGAPSRRLCRGAEISVAALLAVGLVFSLVEGRGAASPATSAAPSARPNVVLIVLDTQRADFIGAYGHSGGLTPHLDRLAASSTVFEHCYTAASWTIPAHASLFTGLYPQTHGASFEQHRYLDERFETVAEVLAATGYETAAFVSNEFIRLANLHQGFAHFEEIGAGFKDLSIRRVLQVVGLPGRFVDHGAMDGVDRVARYLRGRDATNGRPLFLFVNLLEPHWRHFPPLGDRLAILGAADTATATRASSGFYGPIAMARGEDDEALRSSIRGLYAAAVRHQDRQLGRLLDVIDAALPKEDTLLIVTNDHGENLGEAGRWDHVFAVNEHLVHAPLIVRHADFPAAERIAGLCSQIDVPATVADVVGNLEFADADDARSLVPAHFRPRSEVFVAGDPYLGHLERMAVAAGFERDSARWNRALRSARDRRFKYVESSRGEMMLYDLDADPDEVQNVGDRHPERLERLRSALHAWEAGLPAYVADAEASASGIRKEDLERLERLGYAE